MQSTKNSNTEKIDFSKIYQRYKRYWWLFAASFVCCIFLAGVYLYIKKPIYSLTSTVLVSQEEDGSMGAAMMKSIGIGLGGAKVDDEVLVMNAHSIKTKMISELGINRSYSERKGLRSVDYYGNSPITVEAANELFDTLSIGITFKIKVSDNGNEIDITAKKGMFTTLAEVSATSFPVTVSTDFGIYLINSTKYYNPEEDINFTAYIVGNDIKAEAFIQTLSIFTVSKKSNGISLYLEETNIERGKDILNKIVELYNIRGENEKNETANNTADFITERLNIVYGELAKSEQKIEDYKNNMEFIDLVTESSYLILQKNRLDNALTEMETNYSILEMLYEFLGNPNNKNSLVPFTSNLSSAESVVQYNELILQRMNLAIDAKSNNLVLKSLDLQIEALRVNLLSTIQKSKDTADIRIRDLRKKQAESNSKLGNIPTQEREFVELNREREIQSALYSFLLEKREENELVLAASTPKGLIIDKAFAFNEPIAPKKALVVLIALFFSFIIPVALVYIKNLINNKIASLEDLEDVTNTPILGEICTSKSTDALVVKPGKTSSIVELFRLIRNNIQFMLSSNGNNIILVTSSVSGEGKTFVSANLAASFALLGKKVVLVGLDIRNPKIAEYLSLEQYPGVTSYLSQTDMSTNELIQKSEVENLDIIVAGHIPPNPSELLLSSRVEELFNSLREKYDYVIIDSAPVAMVSDTFSLSRYADTLVYVTRAGKTTKSNIKYFNSIVDRGQLKNVSLVLNGTNPKLSSGYGYGYGAKTE